MLLHHLYSEGLCLNRQHSSNQQARWQAAYRGLFSAHHSPDSQVRTLSVVIIITATTGEQLSDCLSDECFVSTYSCHLVVMLISLPHYVEMAGEIFVFSDMFIC